MSAKLVITAGPDEGKSFMIEDDTEATIGRGEAATIRLNDPTISRAHCIIAYSDGKAVLKDNASKTGTRINGKPVAQHILEMDEVISVGTTRIRFELLAVLKKRAEAAKEEEDDEELAEPLGESEEMEELGKLTGTKLAHFQIGPIVGAGNTGVVFKAQDTKDDREVALKVYMPEFAESEEALQRFIRAVKTMLPMRHSNLVTLYGGGKTGPYCWMAMEYVAGENLKETITRIGKGGKLDWRPAMRMCSDLSRGLYYIHGEKIIHRSLSPGNILFSRLGTIKLGSLILAKALSGALAKDVTVGGNFLGEVEYLSPEQVGSGGAVDYRSDIYSLGSLFYALLTGKPPFEGRSQIETATWIVQKEPNSPRKYDPNIPKPLEKIVLKMLAKKAEERFQTTGDLIAELEQLPKV